jgi:hypothetical protein
LLSSFSVSFSGFVVVPGGLGSAAYIGRSAAKVERGPRRRRRNRGPPSGLHVPCANLFPRAGGGFVLKRLFVF